MQFENLRIATTSMYIFGRKTSSWFPNWKRLEKLIKAENFEDIIFVELSF